MFKSKHSGWLSDGTRTPLGGKFLSSLDPSKSISNAFAKVDPGPSIGKGLAEVDKFVNREIPGGWITVGVGAATLYFAPEIMAYASEAGITPAAASLELGVPAVDAAGALVNPATGLAWEATGSGLAGSGAQLTAAEFASQAGSSLTAGDVLKNASRAKKLADMLSPSGGKPNQQQFAQFQQANQPAQEQFGGLYRMNQNPFAQTQQPTSLQAPMAKTPDFLAELSEEGKTQPTLADLLRNA
jgi:hypothetical protein